ncbi:MAG TPA: hypothetical protein ENJ01_08350 [Gammaproteobacteria bacterium]|nr:hypothetical protein [Gammaproteobacteria bacterium]
MNKFNKTFAVLLIMGLAVAGSAQADEFDIAMAETDSWQQNRLFTPSEVARAQEEAGAVIIYEGMRDVDIERAMDEQFDRVEHMMFVSTVITDEDGNPLVDPETGRVQTESDDC